MEYLTVVLLKIHVFWNVTPCRLAGSSRRFGGQQHLHLHQASFAWPGRWRCYYLSKSRELLGKRHGVTIQ